jgi:hypothetical protein
LYINPSYVLAEYGVDWARVERLVSTQGYAVILTNGAQYTGTIEKTGEEGEAAARFKISPQGAAVSVGPNEVVSIRQVEKGFWNQQTGSINVGFNFTQGNSSSQLSISADTEYRRERAWFHLDGSAVFDGQSRQRTSRYTTNFTYNRFLKGRWYTGTIINMLRSDQQELALRASLGEGLGRDFVRTNRTYLSGIAGVMFTNEKYFETSGMEPRTKNGEAVLGLTFSTYRFSTTQLTSQTYLYPNLSTPGRYRIGTNFNVKLEIARNLKWNFGIYENFDSRPPVNAPRNDAGFSTSLGWSF